jgi:hypothetical protein
METKQSNTLLQYGLMSGIVGILFFIALYLVGAKSFASPLAALGYVIPIVFAVLACLREKKNNSGYLDFGKSLKTSFGVFVVSSFLTTLTLYILLNFIDEDFRQAMTQITMEQSEKFMVRFKVPQDKIEKALQEIATSNQYSLSKLSLNFAIFCIPWFLLSLIISAIVKKKNPANEMPQTM